MSNEIELKFEIEQATIKPISQFFESLMILQHDTYHLENTYYDTPDNYLKSHHSSIRVRGIQTHSQTKQYEITVKSSGHAIAGLHQRLEYNANLPNKTLDLSVLPQDILPKTVDLDSLAKQLQAQFTTNFTRRMWLVAFNQSKIEIALDCGSITIPNGHQIPIQEIELELKAGNSIDLITFALQISQFRIHLFSQSKAARGYRLLKRQSIGKMNTISLDHLQVNSALTKLLKFWQTNEEYALTNHDLIIYQYTLSQVNAHLTKILPSIEGVETKQELKKIFNQWSLQVLSIKDIELFAYSEINNQLKLWLIRLLLTLSDQ